MKEKAAAAQKYNYTNNAIPIEPYPITFRADTPSPVDLDKHFEKSGTAKDLNFRRPNITVITLKFEQIGLIVEKCLQKR